MPLAVAFAGKVGSGKTTITRPLAEALGWPRTSFGDYVRKVVRERGIPVTRHNLQVIGTQLLEADPRAFCSSVLSNCAWKAGQNLVIDGLRHTETVEVIRELVRPAALRIVLISTPEATRTQRLKNRGEGSVHTIASIDTHSSEQQITSVLGNLADLVIDGAKPTEMVVAELVQWIGSQSSG